jgi:hypothetical protein
MFLASKTIMDFLSSKPDLYLPDSGHCIRYYDGAILPNSFTSSIYYYDDKCLKEYEETLHSITNSLGTIKMVKDINNIYIVLNGRKSLSHINSVSNPYIVKADAVNDIQVDTNFGVFSYDYNKDNWRKISNRGYTQVHLRGDISYEKDRGTIIIKNKGTQTNVVQLPEHLSCGFGKDYFVMKDKYNNVSFWKF